jgi:hypothetical protein
VEAAIARYGKDARVIQPNPWQRKVSQLVEKLTGSRPLWIDHTGTDSICSAFCTEYGDVAISATNNKSYGQALSNALHHPIIMIMETKERDRGEKPGQGTTGAQSRARNVCVILP